jgi:hypothetical protein
MAKEKLEALEKEEATSPKPKAP